MGKTMAAHMWLFTNGKTTTSSCPVYPLKTDTVIVAEAFVNDSPLCQMLERLI